MSEFLATMVVLLLTIIAVILLLQFLGIKLPKKPKPRISKPFREVAWTKPKVDWAALQNQVTKETVEKTDFSTWRSGEQYEDGDTASKDGNLMHPSVLIGRKDGPLGIAAAIGFVIQSEGHTTLMAVAAPCEQSNPPAFVATEVTIKGAKQAIQMAGPIQSSFADAINDCVHAGILPADQAQDLCIIGQGFVFWEADSDERIYFNNYAAVVMCIVKAVLGHPTVETTSKSTANHPFRGCDRAPKPPTREETEAAAKKKD